MSPAESVELSGEMVDALRARLQWLHCSQLQAGRSTPVAQRPSSQ